MDQVNDFVLASAAFPWVYAVVFAWVLIDAFFPPVPSDVVVVGLTALSISAGVPNVWALALVAALGAIAGDNISYEIGRRIGVQPWRWMKGPRAERAIGSARTSLQRRPVVLMLTARYVPIGRVAVTMVAGATGFHRRRFVALSVLAGISWSAYMVSVGVLAGTWSQANPLLSVGLAIVIASAVGVLIDRSVARLEMRRDLRCNRGIRVESPPARRCPQGEFTGRRPHGQQSQPSIHGWSTCGRAAPNRLRGDDEQPLHAQQTPARLRGCSAASRRPLPERNFMATSISEDPSASATAHEPSQRASTAVDSYGTGPSRALRSSPPAPALSGRVPHDLGALLLHPVRVARSPALLARLAEHAKRAPLPVGVSRPRWWHEVCFVGAIYVIYSLIRNAAPEQVARALQNARSIVRVEHVVGLDIESGTNAFVASLPALAIPANYFYATLYLAVTVSVLVWLYAVRPTEYRRARSVLLTMTLLALVGYWLFPLAPPRLMTGGGFVDTVRYFGTWGVTPSDPVGSVSNQYAAMPSMHVGWALWSGITLACLARSPLLRVLGVFYPVATFLVVVATGNHFVLDAVAALVLFVFAAAIVNLGGRKAAQVAVPGPAPQFATQT